MTPKVKEQKLARAGSRRLGGEWAVTQYRTAQHLAALEYLSPADGSASSLGEMLSLSHVATYVNVTQDDLIQERMWGAPRFSSSRNVGAPLGIPRLHDTLGRRPGSCSPTVQTARPTLAPHSAGHTDHHAQKGQNGQWGLRRWPEAPCVPTGP